MVAREVELGRLFSGRPGGMFVAWFGNKILRGFLDSKLMFFCNHLPKFFFFGIFIK